MHHIIFAQLDPTRHTMGGIPGFVRDLVHFAPPSESFSIVGVTLDERTPLGTWRDIEIGPSRVRFMAVARLDPADQRRVVPHSARFLGGVMRFRPHVKDALIHSHRAEIGAALGLLYRHAPLVQFLHGDTRVAIAHRTETFWRFFPRAHDLLENAAVRRAGTTVVMSTSAYSRLRSSAEGLVLGSNWFDGSVFRPGEREEGPLRLAWAGRLETPKDPLLAIRTFEHVASRIPDASLVVAGSGTLTDEVRRSVARSDASARVTLLGPLDPDALAETLRHAHVFLMTSLWEGFPRGAVEALACGTPVVSTRVGELPRIVRDGVNGFLTSDREPATLAQLVERAAGLPRGAAIARTVGSLEGRVVVPSLFDALELPGRA